MRMAGSADNRLCNEPCERWKTPVRDWRYRFLASVNGSVASDGLGAGPGFGQATTWRAAKTGGMVAGIEPMRRQHHPDGPCIVLG